MNMSVSTWTLSSVCADLGLATWNQIVIGPSTWEKNGKNDREKNDTRAVLVSPCSFSCKEIRETLKFVVLKNAGTLP